LLLDFVVEKGYTMSFQKGRPIKNVLYALTHPLVAAREKPILFALLVGGGVLGLGLMQGWWTLESVGNLIPFLKKG
jgi:hypothetical protein